MYVNVVANSVMLQLYLRHDFYSISFKIKQIIYNLRFSPPLTPIKKFLVCVAHVMIVGVLAM